MNKVQLQFTAYCCRTIRNCKINYIKRNKSPTEQITNSAVNDQYFQVIIRVGPEKFIFTDPNLIESLGKLTPLQRKIILYYYCAEYDDADISKILKRPRSTINYIRRKAIIVLRNKYDEGLL